MKKFLALILFIGGFITSSASAQTTSVTATITDSDSQTWNNGTWTATLYNPQYPNGPFYVDGVKLTPSQIQIHGTMSSSGVLTGTFYDVVNHIGPGGSYYQVQLCPQASAPCAPVIGASPTGSSINLSTTLSANLAGPRFPATGANAYGYGTFEINPVPVPGGSFFNVTSSAIQTWNGTTWGVSGGGGLPLVGGTMTGPLTTSEIVQPAVTALGDSYTRGNQDGSGITYPASLGNDIGQPTLNYGVGGQTSMEIGIRVNAFAGTSSQQFATGFTIPTSGSVTVTFPSGDSPAYLVTGTAGTGYAALGYSGIPISFTVSGTTYTGTVLDNGSQVYSFTPTVYPGSSVSVPINTPYTAITTGMLQANSLVIIEAGRNDISILTAGQIEANVASIVAAVSAMTSNYLVLAIPNGEGEGTGTSAYTEITTVNSAWATAYGSHYLDIREALVAKYNSSNAADVIDQANDIIPFTLRAQDQTGTVTAVASTSTCAITFSNTIGTVGANGIVEIGTELIYISGGSNGAWTCTRGYASTTAATYSSGTTYYVVDILHLGNPYYLNWNTNGAVNSNCPTGGYGCLASIIAGAVNAKTGNAAGSGFAPNSGILSPSKIILPLGNTSAISDGQGGTFGFGVNHTPAVKNLFVSQGLDIQGGYLGTQPAIQINCPYTTCGFDYINFLTGNNYRLGINVNDMFIEGLQGVELYPHLNQHGSKDFAGTCAMSSGTSCTFTLNAAFNSTPICIATQQSATLTGGAVGCTVSGTTVTITSAVANSETWGAMLIGNPN